MSRILTSLKFQAGNTNYHGMLYKQNLKFVKSIGEGNTMSRIQYVFNTMIQNSKEYRFTTRFF